MESNAKCYTTDDELRDEYWNRITLPFNTFFILVFIFFSFLYLYIFIN